jgi:hypothetical protein
MAISEFTSTNHSHAFIKAFNVLNKYAKLEEEIERTEFPGFKKDSPCEGFQELSILLHRLT